MKTCIKCGNERDINDFPIRKDTQKHSNTCAQCIKEYQENYRKENNSILLEKKKIYYLNDKTNIRVKQNQYRKNNLSKYKEKDSTYYKANKLIIISRNQKYKAEKRKTDPAFKLRNNVSRLIMATLKANAGSKKGKSMMEYLPYTIQELKDHLEKQFEPWMNWNNHGRYKISDYNEHDQSTWTWQLDHITPQAQLPYSTMKDDNFQRCWALNNLRPLLAKTNIERSKRLNY